MAKKFFANLATFLLLQGKRTTEPTPAARGPDGIVSFMAMFQQQGSQTEPNRNLFTWSSRRRMLIDRGMI
jgi:hypothetical protein